MPAEENYSADVLDGCRSDWEDKRYNPAQQKFAKDAFRNIEARRRQRAMAVMAALQVARREIAGSNADRANELQTLRAQLHGQYVDEIERQTQNNFLEGTLEDLDRIQDRLSTALSPRPSATPLRVEDVKTEPIASSPVDWEQHHNGGGYARPAPAKRARFSSNSNSQDPNSQQCTGLKNPESSASTLKNDLIVCGTPQQPTPANVRGDRHKSIDRAQAEGKQYIFERDGKFFTIMCDSYACTLRSETFKKHPFVKDLALKHFNHKHHLRGRQPYSEEDIFWSFGYEVIGATGDWVSQSNEAVAGQKLRRRRGTTRITTNPARRGNMAPVDKMAISSLSPGSGVGGSSQMGQAEQSASFEMDGAIEPSPFPSSMQADSVTVAMEPVAQADPYQSIWDVPT